MARELGERVREGQERTEKRRETRARAQLDFDAMKRYKGESL